MCIYIYIHTNIYTYIYIQMNPTLGFILTLKVPAGDRKFGG